MKILGFIFEEKPSVAAHVNYCIKKFNRSLWSLTHLKRAKIEKTTLLEAYKIMLLPLLEYCSPIYSSMLTCDLSNKLERQQATALKIIYSFNYSYADLLSIAGIPRLEERRQAACDSFINSLVQSDRFSHLFPLNEYPEEMVNLRRTKKYQELHARTTRLFNSPLYYMRRRLNELTETTSIK